jgi:glycerol-3-phosphate dehydrogenase
MFTTLLAGRDMSVTQRSSILVLGAGNFGTCLAQHLALKGESVYLWGRSPEVIETINREHRNPRYLSDVDLSPHIQGVAELSEQDLSQTKALVLATPTQGLRPILTKLAPVIGNSHPLIVCAAKGIEIQTLMLPLQVLDDVMGTSTADNAVILSGPSFAIEVVRQQPTAVSVASRNPKSCEQAQHLFHTAFFRAYTSDDPTGLEVAGALKNVMAIAAGACEGLGMQQNARAALLTRSLAEMTRVGVALGANPITFTGLGGVGDLFLTCTSPKSRNFSLGFAIGQGGTVETSLKSLGSTAEGFYTAKAAYDLSRKLGTDTPVINQVYQVLYEGKPLQQAIHELLNRAMKPEITLPARGVDAKSGD